MSTGVINDKPFSTVVYNSEASMTPQEARAYLRALKTFLATHGVDYNEQARIEHEIMEWERICETD